MNNVLIVRLKTGEDIICETTSMENNKLLLNNPMIVNVIREPNSKRPFIALSLWLPIPIIKYNMAEIRQEDVLTLIEPSDDLSEYYSDYAMKYTQSMYDELQENKKEDPLLSSDRILLNKEESEYLELLKKENRLN